jgi:hypothetical protein
MDGSLKGFRKWHSMAEWAAQFNAALPALRACRDRVSKAFQPHRAAPRIAGGDWGLGQPGGTTSFLGPAKPLAPRPQPPAPSLRPTRLEIAWPTHGSIG